MTCLGNIIVISTMFVVLISIQTATTDEIDVKRGLPVYKIKTVPRRQRDPEFMKWDNEDDDYEGSEYAGNEFIRPYFGFTRAGSRMYSNLDDGSSQETIKRSGPGGGAGTWFV